MSAQPEPRPPAGPLELAKWAAILVVLSLGIAALAIPILKWFGYGPGYKP